MTRHHPNQIAWDAIGRLAGRADPHDRDWQDLSRWAAADRETHERGHNGWTNYETWAVALWLNNDEGTHRYWRRAARAAGRVLAADTGAADAARHHLAAWLKDELEANGPDLGASLYANLLDAALEAVDWDEVAEGFLDAVTE